MREIKFRAWWKYEDKWVYTVRGPSSTLHPNGGSFDFIEQFTGLKDKNGREIYEGDKVEDEHGFIKEVCYGNGAFYLKDHDVRYWLHDYAKQDIPGIASNLKVVGTIHDK
jgi:hypothetical protein